MFRKHMLFNTILLRFFIALTFENGPEIDDFSDIFWKRRCCEISQKPLKKQLFLLIFQVPSLKKSTRNRCKNAFEKNIAKTPRKNRFWPPFSPPKTSENRSENIENRSAKRCQTKLVLRRYATRQQTVRSHRAAELWDSLPGLSKD